MYDASLEGDLLICSALMGWSSWRAAWGHLLDLLWKQGRGCVRGCEYLSGWAEGDSSTPRGQRPDACWEIDMLLRFWSVELHPTSAQLPCFNSSGFLAGGLLKGARLSTDVEGAVSLKRLSVHSHWYHTVNSKQRPLSLKEKKERRKEKKRKKKKVKFIYRDSKGNILFILYIYLLYRVYF